MTKYNDECRSGGVAATRVFVVRSGISEITAYPESPGFEPPNIRHSDAVREMLEHQHVIRGVPDKRPAILVDRHVRTHPWNRVSR